MKKLLFTLIGFWGILITFSQAPTTLLYTDFATGIPAGWTQQTEPGANGWQAGTSAQLSSSGFIIPPPPFGTQIIASNDDFCNCETYDWIITPIINAAGFDSLRVFFSAYFTGAFGSIASAAYSTNGGATWQGFNVPANANWSNWQYVLPGSVLTSTMRFAFVHDDNFLWASGFALNEIEISGYSVPSCNLTQPAGAILETETCGQNTNGGCTNTAATPPMPPAYQTLTCGQTVFGTLWANNGTRDLDWYQFTLSTPGIATFSAQSEIPFVLFFVNIANCSTAQILASTTGESCSATQNLSFDFQVPGTYAAVIAPSVFYGFPCNTFNEYIATLQLPSVTPVITPSGPTTICANQSLSLQASGVGNFQWLQNGNPIGSNSSTFTPTSSGIYGVQLTDANNCTTSAQTVEVNINPVDDATFSYVSNTLCIGSGVVNPTFATNGTFTSTPAGLIINPNTGAIDLDNSNENIYQVTFTTSGVCPSSSTQTINVTDEPNASFSYSNSAFCVNDANPQPLFDTGASGGVFSSTQGLVISPNTGIINLAQSTPGTYTVTNTIAASGACPQSIETFDITINAQPTASITSSKQFVCEGDQDAIVTISLNGTPPFNFTFFKGNIQETVQNYNANIFTVSTNTAGQYFIVSLNDANCLGVFSPDIINIGSGPNPTVTFTTLPNICNNAPPLTLTGGSPAGGIYSGPGVNNGIFTPSSVGVGTFEITYTFTDANGCTGSSTQAIKVDDCTSSLEDLSNAFDFNIFPNPASGKVNIVLNKKLIGDFEIRVISLDGKVMENLLVKDIFHHNLVLNIDSYQSGVYFVQVLGRQSSYVKKLVVR